MDWSRHAKYGGVHFTQLKKTQEINAFVRDLPEGRRESMYNVMQELADAGYIRLENDEEFLDPDFEIHP